MKGCFILLNALSASMDVITWVFPLHSVDVAYYIDQFTRISCPSIPELNPLGRGV